MDNLRTYYGGCNWINNCIILNKKVRLGFLTPEKNVKLHTIIDQRRISTCGFKIDYSLIIRLFNWNIGRYYFGSDILNSELNEKSLGTYITMPFFFWNQIFGKMQSNRNFVITNISDGLNIIHF